MVCGNRAYGRDLIARSASCLLIGLAAAGLPASAQVIGVAADDTNNSAVVFDAETGAILSVVRLVGTGLGDCEISVSRQLGFVSDFSGRVSVIDLAASPPRLADGISRIPISNAGQDLALTHDERFLIVAGGGATAPLCVIDVEQRRQVSTLSTSSDNNSVEVAEDGSILASSRNSNRIRRMTIDDAGMLTNTGEFVAFSQPNNVCAAPGGMFGVGIGRAGGTFGSFAVDGMSPVDLRAEDDFGLCGVFSPDGGWFYARFTAMGMVAVYDFDMALGRLSAAPLFTFPVAAGPTQFGVDQIAMHPEGAVLYVTGPGGVRMHHPETGALLGTIGHSALGTLTGIAIADLSPEPPNQPPVITAFDPVVVKSRHHRLHDVGLRAMVDDPDGDAVTVSYVMFSNEMESDNGDGSGRHAPDFKDELFDGGRGFLVRGERMGSGGGRYYLLAVIADDGRGGVTIDACIAAVVPHDSGRCSIERITADAHMALDGLRGALQAGGPMPEGLYEVGRSAERGPHQ